MSISFNCTGCGRTLRVADELAGRKAKCPQCQTILFIPEGPTAAVTPRPLPAAASARRPAAPAAPAARPAHPPRPREEFDDRGPDDYESEEAPRRRKKAKKSMLIPILIAVGAVILLVGGVTVGAIVILPMVLGGGSGADDLYFMPDNTQLVGQVRLGQLMDSDAMKQVKSQFPQVDESLKQLSQTGGMDFSAIDRVYVGGNSTPGAGAGNADMIVVIHTTKSMTVADIEAGAKKNSSGVTFTEGTEGKYTVYDAKASGNPSPFAPPALSFTLINDKEVVMGPSSALHAVLKRDKKPDVSDKLQAAMNKADFNATFAMAMNLKAMMPAQPAAPAGRPGAAGMPPNPAAKVSGVAITGKVGSDIDLSVTVLCDDAGAANELSNTITTGINQMKPFLNNPKNPLPPEVADILNLQPQVSGSDVTIQKTIHVAPVLAFAKKSMGGAGGGGLPFNPFGGGLPFGGK